MNRSREQAKGMLQKAIEDERALKILLDDASSPISAIGFHAQQAVEKRLKALLDLRGIKYARTHDLVLLMDKLVDSGLVIPRDVESADQLQGFAVVFRYPTAPLPENVSRHQVQQCVKAVRDWSEQQFASDPGD